jgi:hypothetical protein
MTANNNNPYVASFFVVPAYIMSLPGLTLSFLRVYETIFQFWNHRKTCFLSLDSICERTTVGRSQVCEALLFFEKHNELQRIKKGGRRYLLQPSKPIETDCTEIIPESGGADCEVRRSGLGESGGADYNNKKLNKENNNTTTSNISFENYKNEEKSALANSSNNHSDSLLKEKFKTEALTDTACNETFKSRFTGIEVTLIQLYEECCDYWSQKNQMVYKARFLTHLKKTPIDKYKTGSSASKYPTKEQRDAEYKKIEQREKESEQRRQQDIDRSAKVKNIDKRKEITQTASSALSSCLNALRQ